MAHLTEAHRYLKMCIQREKKKFQRLEEAQDTPPAELCEGILQTLRGYFGQTSSVLSVGFHGEGGVVKEHREEMTGEAAPSRHRDWVFKLSKFGQHWAQRTKPELPPPRPPNQTYFILRFS